MLAAVVKVYGRAVCSFRVGRQPFFVRGPGRLIPVLSPCPCLLRGSHLCRCLSRVAGLPGEASSKGPCRRWAVGCPLGGWRGSPPGPTPFCRIRTSGSLSLERKPPAHPKGLPPRRTPPPPTPAEHPEPEGRVSTGERVWLPLCGAAPGDRCILIRQGIHEPSLELSRSGASSSVSHKCSDNWCFFEL
jgi:hypothetical protein